MIDLQQIVDMSPPVGLVFGLNLVIFLLKKSAPEFPRWVLPTCSMIAGGIIYPLISSPGDVPYQMRSPVTAQALMGVIMGGCAIGTNQWFKTMVQRFGLFQDDTTFTKKDDV
jgi:hypothetical protein